MNLSHEQVLLSNSALDRVYYCILTPPMSMAIIFFFMSPMSFPEVESPSSFKCSGGICSISLVSLVIFLYTGYFWRWRAMMKTRTTVQNVALTWVFRVL